MWMLLGPRVGFCLCGIEGLLARRTYVSATSWQLVPLGMWMMAWSGPLQGCMVLIGIPIEGIYGRSW
jgi:hypothetical protein